MTCKSHVVWSKTLEFVINVRDFVCPNKFVGKNRQPNYMQKKLISDNKNVMQVLNITVLQIVIVGQHTRKVAEKLNNKKFCQCKSFVSIQI